MVNSIRSDLSTYIHVLVRVELHVLAEYEFRYSENNSL